MKHYSEAAVERMMKIQEVILRAVAGKLPWWQAAEIVGVSFHEKACRCQDRIWNVAMFLTPVVLWLSEGLPTEITSQPMPPLARLPFALSVILLLGSGAHWGPTHFRCCYLHVGLRRALLLRSLADPRSHRDWALVGIWVVVVVSPASSCFRLRF
jgi:hypothetical protein